MRGTNLEPRAVTDDDLEFWRDRNGAPADRVLMRGQHLGALDVEVVRSAVHGALDGQAVTGTWHVPYADPDERRRATYWFTMYSEGFPPVSAVLVRPSVDDPPIHVTVHEQQPSDAGYAKGLADGYEEGRRAR